MNPDPMSSNGDLSIFYGPLGNVAQRAVTAFEQSRSGNGTVTFLVDGTPYVLARETDRCPRRRAPRERSRCWV